MTTTGQEIFNEAQEKQLLWFALKSLRLAPPPELFHLLSNNHIVEVYMGSCQVYRTFNYYSLCSYSLTELSAMPWNQLYFRKDLEIAKQISIEIQNALKEKKITRSQAPAHEVGELSSAQNRFRYELKLITPLKDLENNTQDCFLTVSFADLLHGPVEKIQIGPQPQENHPFLLGDKNLLQISK